MAECHYVGVDLVAGNAQNFGRSLHCQEVAGGDACGASGGNPFVRATQGLLGSEAPFLQQSTDRSHRKIDFKSIENQFPNGLPGPQRKRQLHLVGAPVLDDPHRRRRLMTSQATLTGSTTFLRSQSNFA